MITFMICIIPGLSFLLDLVIGDPKAIVHPVILMGRLIGFLEKRLRAVFPKTERGERLAGFLLAVFVPVLVLLFSGGIYFVLLRFGGRLGLVFVFALDIFWGCQAIAVKDMLKESRNVYGKLPDAPGNGGELDGARRAVGRIVGRDTERLSWEGIIRADIESVAESFSDGMLAPMLYLSVLGAPFAFWYKSINTMDSMIGYKNAKYLHFGRAAARLDDFVNFIPSRLAGLLIIAAAFLYAPASGKRAFQIWKRDRFHHASPNSAQTEAAMAGALGVRLAGGAWYFGEYYDKPYIGDALREVEKEDIVRANRIYFIASILGAIFGCALRSLIVSFVKLLIIVIVHNTMLQPGA